MIDRVLTNVRAGSNGCIETTYSSGSHGYGQVGWHEGGKRIMALTHRVSWAAVNGPIPEDMTIDHLCRNQRCLNVDHLRLLTNVENARDNGNARKTHCPAGHPYAGSNLGIDSRGRRWCRTCNLTRKAKR